MAAAEREIKTALGTYIDENGVSQFAFLGDKVKVHSDHVERFDEFNVPNGDGKLVEEQRAEVEVVNPDPKPRRGRPSSKDDSDD